MTKEVEKIKRQKRKGFTLIEILVAMFIFLMVVLAISGTFAKEITAYRKANAIQRDLENAQFAMGFVAKTLRTSSLSSTMSSGSDTKIRFYDFSLEQCMEYSFDGIDYKLKVRIKDIPLDLWKDCAESTGLSNPEILTTGHIEGQFNFVKTEKSPVPQVGQVTITMQVYPPGGTENLLEKDVVRIQTSVSLRDYEQAGLSF